jgi:O-acetyl-ADP-ribose deacetylase (regulator of RNase III)
MKRLILVDPNADLCNEWKRQFDGLSGVEVVNDRFESLEEFDCMVSPANSFGLMDGGVDLAIISFFGIELMDRVQAIIVDQFLGEQPIGTSMLVETDHPKHPYIAHTPTMRVPMSIQGTDNVYCAMWAMLLAVDHHNRTQARKISTVASPGLGTATGQMSPSEAARQMVLAYRWSLERPPMISWPYALARQAAIGKPGRSESH